MVQRGQVPPGGGVGPDPLTQLSGFVVVEQTCLQIGQQVWRQRWTRVRIIATLSDPADRLQRHPLAPVSVMRRPTATDTPAVTVPRPDS